MMMIIITNFDYLSNGCLCHSSVDLAIAVVYLYHISLEARAMLYVYCVILLLCPVV